MVGKTFLTKETDEGFGVAQVIDFDVELPLHLGPEDRRGRRTNDALEQLALVGVLDGEMDLNRHFRVEHFFAQRALVQMMSVNVHQMLL